MSAAVAAVMTSMTKLPAFPFGCLPAVALYVSFDAIISSSEWPQAIFSGHMSSLCDTNTSRSVDAMNHTAITPATMGSKMDRPVTLTSKPAAIGARETYTSPMLWM